MILQAQRRRIPLRLLVLVKETKCVPCDVHKQFFYSIQLNFVHQRLKCCAIYYIYYENQHFVPRWKCHCRRHPSCPL